MKPFLKSKSSQPPRAFQLRTSSQTLKTPSLTILIPITVRRNGHRRSYFLCILSERLIHLPVLLISSWTQDRTFLLINIIPLPMKNVENQSYLQPGTRNHLHERYHLRIVLQLSTLQPRPPLRSVREFPVEIGVVPPISTLKPPRLPITDARTALAS
ncbi:hypothetical protein FRC02_007060 [Tulasnella sp. 418]|nr:hypothetical protein FRC02_007060 [Tulasnella sp. 418]